MSETDNAASKTTPPSPRTRVRRMAERADYETATLYAILDAAYVCHVAFADDHGVHCIPTACWREGDHLYIHGSNGSRMLKLAAEGAQCCVTITHLDGLVLARSAFHHSMNYRSAMIYGAFDVVPAEQKAAALDAFLEHIARGRVHQVRRGDRNELAATTILRLPLDEAVSKIRTGGPSDDEADLALPVWAGVLPMALTPLPPERVEGTQDTQGQEGQEAQEFEPDYVKAWARRASVTSR